MRGNLTLLTDVLCDRGKERIKTSGISGGFDPKQMVKKIGLPFCKSFFKKSNDLI